VKPTFTVPRHLHANQPVRSFSIKNPLWGVKLREAAHVPLHRQTDEKCDYKYLKISKTWKLSTYWFTRKKNAYCNKQNVVSLHTVINKNKEHGYIV
jgi:hypothetical protein